jgi:hexosaminidase
MTDLAKAYSYDPIASALTPDQRKYVLGAQCQLWSEYIATPAKLEYMAYPRMSALSEVVWTEPENKDFADFRSRLAAGHLARLDVKKVNYRPLDAASTPAAGAWKSGQTSETFEVKEWDVRELVKTAGTYTIDFRYSGGAHRLDIEWAELVVNGKAVRDTHDGQTGGANIANSYKVKLASVPPNSEVKLRASVRSDGGTDSNGEIVISKD